MGLWTPEEFGQFAQLTPDQVKKLRQSGDGPPYVKMGRTVRYVPQRVVEWVRMNERTTTTPRQEKNHGKANHAPGRTGRVPERNARTTRAQ